MLLYQILAFTINEKSHKKIADLRYHSEEFQLPDG